MYRPGDEPIDHLWAIIRDAHHAIERHDPLRALDLADAAVRVAVDAEVVVPIDALLARAYALSDLGRVEEALDVYEIVKMRISHDGDRAGEAHVDMNVALVLGQLGRHDEAVALLEGALAIQLRERDDTEVAACRTNLISALRAVGRLDDALEVGRTAIEAQSGPVGSRRGLADTLVNVANVHLAADSLATAREMLLEALDLYRKLDLPTEEADCLSSLGIIARREGLIDFAVSMHTEAIDRYEGRGHDADQAIARYHLALAELWRGNPLAALEAATLATGVPGADLDPAMVVAAALDQLGRGAEAAVERQGFVDRHGEEVVAEERTRLP